MYHCGTGRSPSVLEAHGGTSRAHPLPLPRMALRARLALEGLLRSILWSCNDGMARKYLQQ
eukprot:10822728-Alexandrium_andersonii.AAC.1